MSCCWGAGRFTRPSRFRCATASGRTQRCAIGASTGFFNLDGKLAYNVAGEGLPADVKVYSGHQPTSLYLAGLVTWLTGCTDGLAAHLVFTLIIGLGIWWLLGRGELGALAALLSVFSPGYLRFVALLDPVGIPILLAIPMLAWMRGPLGREKLGIGPAGLMAAVLALYAALNWSSVCGFAIFGAYLVATLPGKYRRLLFFMVGCGLAGGAVLAVSVLSKKGPSAASGASASGFATLFNNYLFGPGGYAGYPMNWPRAIVRLGANIVVSLMPLWGLFFVLAWRSFRRRTGGGWAWLKPLWPVLVAWLFIFGLRNYFAAQPWMAGPVVVCGVAFSLRLMLDSEGARQSQDA